MLTRLRHTLRLPSSSLLLFLISLLVSSHAAAQALLPIEKINENIQKSPNAIAAILAKKFKRGTHYQIDLNSSRSHLGALFKKHGVSDRMIPMYTGITLSGLERDALKIFVRSYRDLLFPRGKPFRAIKAFRLGDDPNYAHLVSYFAEKLETDVSQTLVLLVKSEEDSLNYHAISIRPAADETAAHVRGFSVHPKVDGKPVEIDLSGTPLSFTKGAVPLQGEINRILFGAPSLVIAAFPERADSQTHLGSIVHEVFHEVNKQKQPEIFQADARKKEHERLAQEAQQYLKSEGRRMIQTEAYQAWEEAKVETLTEKYPHWPDGAVLEKTRRDFFFGFLKPNLTRTVHLTMMEAEKAAYLFQAQFLIDTFGIDNLYELNDLLFRATFVPSKAFSRFTELVSGRRVFLDIPPTPKRPLLSYIGEKTGVKTTWEHTGVHYYQCSLTHDEKIYRHGFYLRLNFDQRRYWLNQNGQKETGKLENLKSRAQKPNILEMNYTLKKAKGKFSWVETLSIPQVIAWTGPTPKGQEGLGVCWRIPVEASILVD